MIASLPRQLLTGMVLPLLFCDPTWSQQGAEPPADFRIFPQVSFQTMSGFGAGICETTLQDMQPLGPKDRHRLYELVYGEDGLRLNIIRIHISPNAQLLPAGGVLRKQGLLYDWEHDAHTQNVLARSLRR